MEAATRTSARAHAERIRAAFLELHGPRLHGFALLVTLGDRDRAANLASEALTAGVEHATQLRHPERAAAWLRAMLLRSGSRRVISAHRRNEAAERRSVLASLGVDDVAFAGLKALTPLERGAIAAAMVERLDERDQEAILGCSPAAARRLVIRARRRYLEAASRVAQETSANERSSSELTDRLALATKRVLE